MSKTPKTNKPNKLALAFRRFLLDIHRHLILISCIVLITLAFTICIGRVCPIALLTGFPCPGCGITRSLFLLITLHPMAAFFMNPSIYLWIICFVLFFIFHYIYNNTKAANTVLIITGLLTIAVYIIGMLLYYPDTAPYQYFKPNLLDTVRTFLSSIIRH